MEPPHDAVLLRIFTSAADRWQMGPLYLAIVEKARELQLAGATVIRASAGFGQSGKLHRRGLLPSLEGTPIIVEIVDNEPKINAFLPVLDEMMESGLVTIEQAKVLQYGRQRTGFFTRLRQQLGFGHHLSAGQARNFP